MAVPTAWYAGPSTAARKGAPVDRVSTVTRTPHGAAERKWPTRAFSAWSGSVPGGIRRFSRAAARGTIAAVDPNTGGQSMPSTVITGRPQHVGDAAVTQQLGTVHEAGVVAELLR